MEQHEDDGRRQLVEEMLADGRSVIEIADVAGCSERTVYRIKAALREGARERAASAPLAGRPLVVPPTIPKAVSTDFIPVQVDDVGHWLMLTDLHFPYHDAKTIELAVEHARRDYAVGVLLNGDIMDCHFLSDFDKDPSKPRYIQERDYLIQFLRYLRHYFPSARIIYREGNHEERLKKYLMRKAPELFGFDEVSFPSLMKLADFDVEYVGDCRVVNLGRLHTIHGHEFKDRFTSVPVNPARKFFLQAKSNVIGGHHHQPSEHNETTISGKSVATWSIGCGCDLHPQYKPLNKWSHGYALVEVSRGGEFSVRNMRVINGRSV